MLPVTEKIPELSGLDPRALPEELLRSTTPIVLRGLVAQWPMVQAAQQSSKAGSDYLRGLYRGAPVDAFFGAPQYGGRFFYNDDCTGFNFHPERLPLNRVLDEIESNHANPQPPAIYVGSASVDDCLPEFRQHNDVDLGDRNSLASIWIGNRTRIAAHYDAPDNLACVAAGHRRFTLFPPEALENLYVGPIDLTPAGQPISLVDFADPDFEKFPKFAEALKVAQVAEMEPGDAIFIPSMWWHHIEALDSFNVLVNYWWRQSPDYMDPSMNALMLAIMSVRDLPPAQRKAWQGLFNHYVFEADDETTAHIPIHARRVLGPLNADTTRMLRTQLLKKLNR
ncbi:MAG: cupin-like domain-containing protein [Rhodoferax sp.]|nr:cupin-like domain-containing protein [Rhodoferax sp.]